MLYTVGSSIGLISLIEYGYVLLGEINLPYVTCSASAIIYMIKRDKKAGKLPPSLFKAYF